MATYDEKLKDLIKKSGQKSEYISNITKIHKSTLSKYKNGNRTLYENDAYTLGEFFDVDVDDYLLNDEVEIIDNPSEVYPFKTREQKKKEQNELIKGLQENIDSFNKCDKYFKQDVIDIINRYKSTYQKYDDFIDSQKSILEEKKLIGLVKPALSSFNVMVCSNIFKMNVELKKIERFIDSKNGEGLYLASKAIFKINKWINEDENVLRKTNEFIKELCDICDYNNKINEENKLLFNRLSQKLDEVFKLYQDGNANVHHLIVEFPEFDIETINIFRIVTLYKSYFYFVEKTYNVKVDVDDILKDFFIELAYDSKEKEMNDDNFMLSCNEDTVEKLYRYFMNSIFEEVDLSCEIENYKNKATAWLEEADQVLTIEIEN